MNSKQMKKEMQKQQLIEALSTLAGFFVLAAFVRLSWNAIADVANLPTFGYWEYFSFTVVFNYLARSLKGILGHGDKK